MRRVAIFVEGQSELIFVREFLLKWFNYEIQVECRALLTAEKEHHVDYDFPNPTASLHIQVINVGMDGNVLSRILKREQYLHNSGYNTIVGLRDMYSEEYIKLVKTRMVDLNVNNRFREGTAHSIQKQAVRPEAIQICFAIMELEAWWLGIPSLWQDLAPIVKQHYNQHLDLPEAVFHPAEIVHRLFQSKQQTYSKHRSEVESIVGQISREAYVDLHSSQRCPSFCEFVDHIQPQQTNL